MTEDVTSNIQMQKKVREIRNMKVFKVNQNKVNYNLETIKYASDHPWSDIRDNHN